MLEILSAIKNNNVNKIPTSSEQCYSTYIEHIQKVIRTYYKYNKTPAELTISYEDLLNGWYNFYNFKKPTLRHNQK
jgi:hypothetical protein